MYRHYLFIYNYLILYHSEFLKDIVLKDSKKNLFTKQAKIVYTQQIPWRKCTLPIFNFFKDIIIKSAILMPFPLQSQRDSAVIV